MQIVGFLAVEDICFFEVNTKYISSSELKTSEGGGGLICAHAPILFLLCMVNAFILTPIKMHLFVLKNIVRSQDSTLTYSTFVTIPALFFAYISSLI